MLNMIPLDERTLIAGQIRPEDLDSVAKAGVRLVVNNRPDGEALMGQPETASIAEAARAAGVAFIDLPFNMQSFSPEIVASFGRAMKENEGRVLAYCRSGSRSSMLWAASQVAAGADVDAVLAQAQAAGIDLSQARPLIEGLGKAAAQQLAG
jgi:uncharacterized protein (TIGR01244 family)